MASTAESTVPKAVSMITSSSGCSTRICRRRAMPSSRGILRSVISSSKLSRASSFAASAPSAACVTT